MIQKVFADFGFRHLKKSTLITIALLLILGAGTGTHDTRIIDLVSFDKSYVYKFALNLGLFHSCSGLREKKTKRYSLVLEIFFCIRPKDAQKSQIHCNPIFQF